MPELIDKTFQAAIDGDLVATRLILDRMWPTITEQTRELEKQVADLKAELAEAQRARGLRRVA